MQRERASKSMAAGSRICPGSGVLDLSWNAFQDTESMGSGSETVENTEDQGVNTSLPGSTHRSVSVSSVATVSDVVSYLKKSGIPEKYCLV